MTMKKTICLLLFFGTWFGSIAQDPLFTQYQYAPTFLNPAMIGTGKKDLRLSALTKMQWFNLYKPFKYIYGAADYSMFDDIQRNILNLGLNVYHSNKGNLGNTNISGLVGRSFGTNNTNCSNWYLSLALQAGYNFAQVNPNAFIFSDQIDQTGITGSASQVDLFSTPTTKNYFDFSSGFVLTISDFMIGGSAHHLNKPNVSFAGKQEDAKLKTRFSFHANYRFETEYLTIKPTIMYSTQGLANFFSTGSLIDYYGLPVEFGLWYRNAVGMANNNAICVSLSWKWKEAKSVVAKSKEYSNRMGLSYDTDISRPGLITTHGSMEFGIQKEIQTNNNAICPNSNSLQCNFRFPWEFL